MSTASAQRIRRKKKRRLTAHEVTLIAKLIKGRPSSQALAWEGVVDLAKSQFGYEWTRQTLQAHPDIKDAYSEHARHHQEFRETGKPPRTKAPEIVVLQQKLEKEQADNASLRETLRQYDELLCTYMSNAIRHGISPEQLGVPLVPPYRAQTDGPRRPTRKKARESRNA